LRDIEPGEELGYEYGLTWESTDDPDELKNYTCRCGAKECRGTMLAEDPLDKKRVKRAGKKAKKKVKAKAKTKAKGKAKAKAKAKVGKASQRAGKSRRR
jgi:hypothetical protein